MENYHVIILTIKNSKIGEIFMKYLVVDDDVPANKVRTSGFGSTGK